MGGFDYGSLQVVFGFGHDFWVLWGLAAKDVLVEVVVEGEFDCLGVQCGWLLHPVLFC